MRESGMSFCFSLLFFGIYYGAAVWAGRTPSDTTNVPGNRCCSIYALHFVVGVGRDCLVIYLSRLVVLITGAVMDGARSSAGTGNGEVRSVDESAASAVCMATPGFVHE